MSICNFFFFLTSSVSSYFSRLINFHVFIHTAYNTVEIYTRQDSLSYYFDGNKEIYLLMMMVGWWWRRSIEFTISFGYYVE